MKLIMADRPAPPQRRARGRLAPEPALAQRRDRVLDELAKHVAVDIVELVDVETALAAGRRASRRF